MVHKFTIFVLTGVLLLGISKAKRQVFDWFQLPHNCDKLLMMTSSNGNIFRVIVRLCGEIIVTGEFPSQSPVTQNFDIFFDLCLDKRLCKQSGRRWFETPSRSLWRHSNATSTVVVIDGRFHDDVIKWKHFPRYWPFVRGPVNCPHKGQWHRALMFTLICARINDWVNNREAGDLRRYRTHFDVIVMYTVYPNHCTCAFGLFLVVTCQNYPFGKSVRLSVFTSVCLFLLSCYCSYYRWFIHLGFAFWT